MSGPARLDVRVTPGAKKSAWAGRMPDGRRKVKIAAPPVDGRANHALLAFVAESLSLSISSLMEASFSMYVSVGGTYASG